MHEAWACSDGMGILLFNQLLVELLALLDNVWLLEELFERKVTGLQKLVNGRGLGKPEPPKHSCGRESLDCLLRDSTLVSRGTSDDPNLQVCTSRREVATSPSAMDLPLRPRMFNP
jgi:hypothetical protein